MHFLYFYQGIQSEDTRNSKQKKPFTKKKKNKSKKIDASISFDELSVDTVSNSSGIFNGKNIQIAWSSHSKSNTGFGTVGGHDNKVYKNTNVLFDNDVLDTPIDDRDTILEPNSITSKNEQKEV